MCRLLDSTLGIVVKGMVAPNAYRQYGPTYHSIAYYTTYKC